MAMMAKKGGGEGEEENIFWVTMSDLMLGLACVFMTLFVLAMTGFTQTSVQQKQEQMEAVEELADKLKEADINAEVDKMTGDIIISDLELFEVNSWTLSKRGQEYLDKLVPIYVNTIFTKPELDQNIANIVVQGHTDSQSFAGLSTKDEQFVRNMELSLKRANSVAEYMFKTNFDKKHSADLRHKLVVEGKSFTEPIMVNGKEDYAKSRRVELKLKVNTWDIKNMLGF